MDSKLTAFDMRMIKSLNGKLSDEDIANIVRYPIDQITNFILHSTGKLNPFKAKYVKKPKPATPKRSHKVKLRKATEPKRDKASKVNADWERQRKQSEKRENSRACKTVEHDFSSMILVQVNNKTSIYIKKGEDPLAAIERYHKRMAQKTDYRNMPKTA